MKIENTFINVGNKSLFAQSVPAVIRKIQEKGLREKTPIIDESAGKFLQMLSLAKQPSSILEIGTGISCSTHWLLYGHPDSTITSLDQNHVRIAISSKFLTESGMSERVSLKQVWAKEFLRTDIGFYDLIFLDSMKKEYFELMDLCLARLKTNGMLIADNVLFKGLVEGPSEKIPKKYSATVNSLKKFNKSLLENKDLETFIINIGDGVLVSLKKSRGLEFEKSDE